MRWKAIKVRYTYTFEDGAKTSESSSGSIAQYSNLLLQYGKIRNKKHMVLLLIP